MKAVICIIRKYLTFNAIYKVQKSVTKFPSFYIVFVTKVHTGLAV